jgi:hypothetical protein
MVDSMVMGFGWEKRLGRKNGGALLVFIEIIKSILNG